MIVKMHKYTFWVYHKEYNAFLEPLQEMGILHVEEKHKKENHEVKHIHKELNRIERTIQHLTRRGVKQSISKEFADVNEVVHDISSKEKELKKYGQKLRDEQKLLKKAAPWGEFSNSGIQKLENEGIFLKFFVASRKKFNPDQLSDLYYEVVSQSSKKVYFVVALRENTMPAIDADEVRLPEKPVSEINRHIADIEKHIAEINADLDNYAASALPSLRNAYDEVLAEYEFEKTMQHTESESKDTIRLLQGWVPDTQKKQIDAFLEENNIVYLVEKPSENDNIPILVKNNRFSKLFEPIGKLFALPAYAELDLTVFFAPFFMLFFGFCLGDAGYGLLFVIGAGLYKLKAKKEIKPILSLMQFLGLATVLFGVVTGTFFGINLIETEVGFLENYRQFFLNPDKMFNMALILGAVQIIFALFLKAANKARQFGFAHALSTIGWIFILLGTAVYFGLTQTGLIPENVIILYSILGFGGFFVIFFSDVKANIFSRIGQGIWDVYSTITGIFGDVLSYIRLFALGLSSAILGFVINDIGMQILGSSKILGPIFFVVFLLLGHTLNILIASLGAFVHPMRLTFVEFYKNAGFKGGGKAYRPFSKKQLKVKENNINN